MVDRELSGSLLDLLVRMINFSMRSSAGLSRRLTGPRDAVICLRFSVSDLLMVRVSRMVGKNTSEKVATPIIRFTKLLKASCACRTYAAVPARAEEKSILADDAQSMSRW